MINFLTKVFYHFVRFPRWCSVCCRLCSRIVRNHHRDEIYGTAWLSCSRIGTQRFTTGRQELRCSQWRSQIDNREGRGGGQIHIFVFTYHKNNWFPKKLITQNMNIWICPTLQLSFWLRHWLLWSYSPHPLVVQLVFFWGGGHDNHVCCFYSNVHQVIEV